ncbi:electron transfer flavoprotein subunit beta/FixA family protein [Gordonibacter sp. 28C]|uniref:electron transfer flavoprotein subunit beta/FixA family protein n=1 Tax=Gordonibacter sp. 28C TaxID=2078569 RepID=UPI000DF8640E|nr:electron transfer flavoprotein subunit beta/FixA family protein [Gordonibacter sp. 28C]RDB64440.1 electron transfer flavoprotein subunit beta/FixA family protein [Gordonibacter sp. 28C]
MRIVVCIKQCIDAEAITKVDDHGQVIKEGQSLVIDPYSEFAVERALQAKDCGEAETIALAIGGQEVMPTIRHALAMGVDSGCLVDDPAIDLDDPVEKSIVLAKALTKLQPDLIMGGYKSGDTSQAQVIPRLATFLKIPYVGIVTHLEIGEHAVEATHETDDGFEIIQVELPAAIAAQQGLAEPRYPSVRGIMQSKKKPVEIYNLEDIGLSPSELDHPKPCVLPCRPKPARKGGRIMKGELSVVISDVVAALKSDGAIS